MKHVIILITLVVAVMYIIAEATLEREVDPNITALHWATDPNPTRNEQVARFNTLNPDLKLIVDPGLGRDMTKLRVQCATGVGPDLIDIYTEEQMIGLVNAGILLDLTPYAKAEGFSVSDTYASTGPALTVEDKQYRFPCNVSASCVLYNKAIFDDHGVPYPEDDWTWDDFIAVSKQIMDNPSKSGETHIAVANYSPFSVISDLMLAYGGRRFSEDGLTCTYDSPENIAAMQDYHDMIYVHEIMPTPAEAAAMSSQGGWGSGALNWFSGGRAAMVMAGRWYTIQLPHFPELQGNLGSVLMPRLPGRDSVSRAVCRGAGINVNSPNREEAIRFLSYLASPEYSAVIVSSGDGLPPNPNFAKTGADLVNEISPDPAFHQTFIDAVRRARSLDNSPYIDAQLVHRWFTERIEQVENQVVAPEEAMKSLAQEINKEIEKNLRRGY